MPTRPYLLTETTWKTVKATPYEIAILPWGATEAHNYHLPFGTDNLQCDYIAAESARRAWERGAKAVVLPTVPFGVNTSQLDIKLTINMNPSTQAAVLHDVAASLAQQGVPKLVVLNGHGGNDFRQMIRELQPLHNELFICAVNWYQVEAWDEYFADLGDHGGEVETSVMLHLAPHLVRPLEEAGDGSVRGFKLAAFREKWAWAPRHWTRVTRDTGVGNPAAATAAKGEKFVTAVIEKIADFLVELAATSMEELYEEHEQVVQRSFAANPVG